MAAVQYRFEVGQRLLIRDSNRPVGRPSVIRCGTVIVRFESQGKPEYLMDVEGVGRDIISESSLEAEA